MVNLNLFSDKEYPVIVDDCFGYVERYISFLATGHSTLTVFISVTCDVPNFPALSNAQHSGIVQIGELSLLDNLISDLTEHVIAESTEKLLEYQAFGLRREELLDYRKGCLELCHLYN